MNVRYWDKPDMSRTPAMSANDGHLRTRRSRSEEAQASFHVPAASLTHFLVKLSFAAPDNFLSAACLSQDALASVSHFFIKLVCAAPLSFFASDCALQLSAALAPPIASA